MYAKTDTDCVKLRYEKHFLSDISNTSNKTGTVPDHISKHWEES